MKRHSYVFVREPFGSVYRNLLEYALRTCKSVGLIMQVRGRPVPADDVIVRLEPYLLDRREVNEWPGSQLAFGHRARRDIFSFGPPVVGIMLSVADGLYDWENVELPDDPHLLRDDGGVWLGTVVHERDAWLELDEDEYRELAAEIPDVAALLQRERE